MKRSRYVVKASGAEAGTHIFYNVRNGLGFKTDADKFEALARRPELQRALRKYGFFHDPDEAQHVLETYVERRENAPFHLVVMPHQNCNFRCVYCYEKFDKNKMSPDVESGLVRLAEERLSSGRHRLFSVSWFGGEPLLAPDVIERLSQRFRELADANGADYVATITTNGYFLSDDVIDMLLEQGVRSFQITVDGVRDLHDRQRLLMGGQPTYDRIVGNLLKLSQRPGPFRVMVRMNVGPENVQDVQQHIAEMKERFGADDRFLLYFHNIGHWGGPNDGEIEICSESMAVKLTRMTLDSGMHAFPLGAKIRPDASCYAASPHSFVVGVDGMVYKCTVALYDERNHVGRLHADGHLELSSEKMALWTEGGVQDSGCRECFFAPSCHGDSCPLVRLEEGRRPCPSTKGQIQDIITLMDRQNHPFVDLREIGEGSVKPC